MMWQWNAGMGWWMVFGGIMMIVFWGAIIWLIVWGIRKATEGNRRGEKGPLDIARERYARGEITREQFEQIKRDLS